VELPRQLNDKEELAVASTLFIFHRIFKCEGIKEIPRSFSVSIDSDMSIGAGVGSSASYGVCLAAGFFIHSQLVARKVESPGNFQFTEEILERVSQWAFDSEVIMHEKPSGIDNTICTFGQLVKFNRGEKPQPIKTMATIDILLVDTRVSRSTSHVVGKVANFRNRHLNLANSIFDSMGFLVDDVVKILEADGEKFQDLSELVTVNNNLLRAIGVSHPRLEKVFSIAEGFGFNAKLTGAGAGGCAFVFLPSNYEKLEKYEKMCNELKENDYEIMATIIGGRGVDLNVKD
jgi:mevalonate kinase